MARFIASIPKIVVALLLIAAIVNLLIGVFLRYVMIPVTDWLDVDSIPFTWVEEVGEMLLAWLTLIGAAIGVRERNHFTLHVLHFSPAGQAIIDRVHYSLVAIVGAIAGWYGVRLCMLNHTLVTPGLSINLSLLYGSAAVGGALLVVYALSMIVAPPPPRPDGVH
ncbi:MAG: TRAP transporter small permease subunit [Alphaproteobacteria bacterium]|nr:MAG: TRAP transporter small permease subunit [Alphaproteobacteria bacterium]